MRRSRRAALALSLVGLAGLVGGASSLPADTGTDQPLVTATVYAADGSSVANDSVTAATLQADSSSCPGYAGQGITLQGADGGTASPVPGATWALGDILPCLSTPVDPHAVQSLVVFEANGAPEPQLTAGDLAGAPSSGFPAGQTPFVADAGSSYEYDVPPRNSAEDNARLSVSTTSAIQLAIYEGTPLTATIVATPGSTPGSYRFSASVAGDTGTHGLTYLWDFGDGDMSTTANPTETFVAGTFSIGLQVADAGSGQSGTASTSVTVTATPAPPSGPATGTTPAIGTTPTSTSPTGPVGGHGQTPGAGPTGVTGPASHPKSPAATHPSSHPSARGRTGTTGGAAGPSGSGTGSGRATPATTPSSPVTVATPPGAPASAVAPAASVAPASSVAPAASVAPASPVRPAAHPASRSSPPASGTPAHRRKPTLTGAAPPTPRLPGRVVTGRLISDVRPVVPAASPLVVAVTTPNPAAPGLRRGARTSAVPGLAAGLVIVLLFGLGAVRELRGRRAWRLPGRAPKPV